MKPNTKKITIVTNNINCERQVQYYSTLEKYFVLNGWSVSDNYDSDKVVICACGFSNFMYERIIKKIEYLKSIDFLEKDIIIWGCLPKTHQPDLEENFKGQIIELQKEEEFDKMFRAEILFKEVKKINVFRRHFFEKPNKDDEKFHIKISEGCLMKCTFCVINKAKGYIKSFPKEEILAQVKEAIKIGKPDIMFMGEDTFAYGIDTGSSIIELIRYIKRFVPEANLNFGYLHMQWLLKYSDDILELCKEGIFSHLHIGLQHVNDTILTKMGRDTDFKKCYETLCLIKEALPSFEFGADIVVGFPGETEEHFNELIQFFETDKCFNKIRHFGYSDVRGSRSAGYDNKVSEVEILERWQKLDKVLGNRAYVDDLNENSIEDTTFKVTKSVETFICSKTFFPDIENLKTISKSYKQKADNSVLLDNTDLNFNR